MTSLSILIAPAGESSHLRACLESLWKTLPPGFAGEVLAPAPPGAEPPSHLLLRFIPDDPSGNMAACRNTLVRASRSGLLLLLSPGTVLLPGWLPPMLDALRRFPNAGCVGNVQREPYSGLIEHAGIRFSPDGLPSPTAHSPTVLPPDLYDRHPAVSLACALLRRELFDRLDGFDESFHGPLGDVDFCLRAASLGRRHYVANRSVVYHDETTAPDRFAEPDLTTFRARWGERARAALARRAALRQKLPAAPFSREAWEMAREDRRIQRQAIRVERTIGNTYLRKHLHRPWRYNAGRLGHALAKAMRPLPPALPPALGGAFRDADDLSRPDDGWLFDPPPQ